VGIVFLENEMNRFNLRYFIVIAIISAFAFVFELNAENASRAIEAPFKEHPTLHCLGARWKIKGDANRNAVIEVRFRQTGEEKWRMGFPLFRCIPNASQGGKSTRLGVPGGWMFAGSIFDLEPDTNYEVRLNLKDPDGGGEEQVLTMKTWKEPLEPPGMKKVHVQPGDGGGSGTEPDPFKGIVAALASAKPGTLFLLHKGTYPAFTIKADGQSGKPIIFRGAGDGEAIIDAGGSFDTKGSVIYARDRKHLWFESLTVRGAFYAINANSASHFVIRRCKFREVGKGFNSQNGGYNKSVHHFIADNDIVGPTKWPRTKGIESYCLTYISGGGHVVCHNRMYNVGDGMHGTGHGTASACDFYNNDMNICTDDGIETDHCEFNMRVWGNRIRNVAHGITVQPSRAGPVYIFRNFIYNATYSPFKLHNHTTGVLLIHNTCMKQRNAFNIVPASESVLNVVMRNNLFLTASGTGLYVGTPNCRDFDIDSDGYGGFQKFARWNRRTDYKTIADAKKAGQIYQGRGAYMINPATCFASGLKPPANRDKEYTIDELDFRLAEKSDAVDKGVVLPNLNDNFQGTAPDLGALEYGDEPPHFGPRAQNEE
jgi:hypothetical protein